MTAQEHDPFTDVLNDINTSDKLVIDNIAQRVNERVAIRVGLAPKGALSIAWQSYVVSAALLIGVGVLAFWLWPADSSVDQDLVDTNISENTSMGAVDPASSSSVLLVRNLDGNGDPSAQTTDFTADNKAVVNRGENEVKSDIGADVEPSITTDDDPTEDGRITDPERQTPNATIDTDPTLQQSGPDDQNSDRSAGNSDSGTGNGDANGINNGPKNIRNTAIVEVKLIDRHTHFETKASTNDIRDPNLGRGTKPKNENTLLPEEMPYYSGGEVAMERFVKSKIERTIQNKPELIGESVYVSFIVNSRGKVSDIEARCDNPTLKEEAERIVTSMPDWHPGSKKGKIDAVISITFR